MSIEISAKKCISCGACVIVCPQNAISLLNGAAHVDLKLCTACLRCISKCYMRAISKEGVTQAIV